MSETLYEESFSYFQSQRTLNKYVRELSQHVEPVEITLQHPDLETTSSMQYVPVLKTIQALLQHDDVFTEIYEGHQTRGDLLEDFCDSHFFKKNPIFARDHMNLQLILYYDDFTLGNPLTNKAKKTKISGFYFGLGNLHPKFRSRLHVIQLAILCKSVDVKKYGIDNVLHSLLEDVKKLEQEGICIYKDGVEYKIYGTIAYIPADNLGAHAIGGFMESFSKVDRLCRYCNLSRIALKNHFRMSPLIRCRSKAGYTQQAEMVAENGALASFYGLKRNSSLNELQYYHVTEGLPGDMAHDLLEGIVPEVLECVIRYCVRSGYFDLPYLNKQVNDFPYNGPDKACKPSTMSENMASFKVKQTQAQAWCLLRLIPLMVGSNVPLRDNAWEVLLALCDVVEYSTCPKYSPEMADFLADLIEEFLTMYFAEFPTQPMKPKFHYLVHYPEMMLNFGPLVHCWTMRYEAKHNYFKEVYQSTKNTRNICKTLAERHEFMQAAYRSTKSNFLVQEEIESTYGMMYPVDLLPACAREFLHQIEENMNMVYKAESVKYEGITYSRNSAVIIKNISDHAVFAIIEDCFIVGGIPFLFCQPMKSKYLHHMHAFHVESDRGCRPILCQPSELSDHQPLALYHTDVNNKVVPLRHKFLVAYNDHNARMSVENDNSMGATKEELECRAVSLFNLDETYCGFIQMWDDEFECFVDVNKDDIVKGGTKLKLMVDVKVLPVTIAVSQHEGGHVVMQQEDKNNEVPDPEAYNVPVVQDQGDGDDIEIQADVDAPDEHGDMQGGGVQDEEDQKCVSNEDTSTVSQIWHIGWKLPTFPPVIAMKLEAGATDLSVSERGIVLEEIYKDVTTKYTYYPKPNQYNVIVDQLFRKYPALGKRGMLYGDVKVLWKNRLTQKFQNLRGNEPEEVQAGFRKLKRKSGNSTVTHTSTTVPPQWGLANYLPKRPEGEDEGTITKHRKLMQDEKKRQYPDIKSVRLSMGATLSDRREKIVEGHALVTEVQEWYPWLFDETQLMDEMDRLMGQGQGSYYNKFCAGLKKYGKKIVHYVMRLKKPPTCFKVMASKVQGERDEKEKEKAIARAALLGIPMLFREKVDDMFLIVDPDKDAGDSPLFIEYQNSIPTSPWFKVHVDGVEVSTSSDLLHGVCCYVSAVYAFNVANPNKLKKTLLFLEKVVLGFEDGQPSKPLITVVSKLNTKV